MRKMICGIILVMIMISAVACASADGGKRVTDSEEAAPKVSTDLDSIAVFFPKLEGAQEAEWEQITLGSGDSRVPGPTDYKYQGYVVISDDTAEQYASTYEWKEAEPEVKFENIQERSGNWKYSNDFAQDMLQGRYGGSIWIDGNLILFSITTQ